jgi:diguanylate cyclase (GGDEF)-like protein
MTILKGLFILLILYFFTAYFLFRYINKRHAAKLKEVQRQFDILHQTGLKISSVLEFDKLLQTIMEAFAEVGKISKGSLMLLNEEEEILEIKAGIGISEEVMKTFRLRLGEGVAGIVAATGKPILINDNVTKDRIFFKDFSTGKIQYKETLLSLPLIYKGKVVGVINLDSKTTNQPFNEEDVSFFSILASYAAIAISNAYLYETVITDITTTKLYTSKYFMIRLEEEMNRSKRYNFPVSVALLEIDNFGQFQFNHSYNNEQIHNFLLTQVAKLIKENIRITDIPARYGEKKFAIIFIEADEHDAYNASERLRKVIENKEFSLPPYTYKITISVGVGTYHGEKTLTREEFIYHVESALEYAKQYGGNQTVAYEKIS